MNKKELLKYHNGERLKLAKKKYKDSKGSLKGFDSSPEKKTWSKSKNQAVWRFNSKQKAKKTVKGLEKFYDVEKQRKYKSRFKDKLEKKGERYSYRKFKESKDFRDFQRAKKSAKKRLVKPVQGKSLSEKDLLDKLANDANKKIFNIDDKLFFIDKRSYEGFEINPIIAANDINFDNEFIGIIDAREINGTRDTYNNKVAFDFALNQLYRLADSYKNLTSNYPRIVSMVVNYPSLGQDVTVVKVTQS